MRHTWAMLAVLAVAAQEGKKKEDPPPGWIIDHAEGARAKARTENKPIFAVFR